MGCGIRMKSLGAVPKTGLSRLGATCCFQTAHYASRQRRTHKKSSLFTTSPSVGIDIPRSRKETYKTNNKNPHHHLLHHLDPHSLPPALPYHISPLSVITISHDQGSLVVLTSLFSLSHNVQRTWPYMNSLLWFFYKGVPFLPPPICPPCRSQLSFSELLLKGRTAKGQITLHTVTVLQFFNHISPADKNDPTETTCRYQSSPKQIIFPQGFVVLCFFFGGRQRSPREGVNSQKNRIYRAQPLAAPKGTRSPRS